MQTVPPRSYVHADILCVWICLLYIQWESNHSVTFRGLSSWAGACMFSGIHQVKVSGVLAFQSHQFAACAAVKMRGVMPRFVSRDNSFLFQVRLQLPTNAVLPVMRVHPEPDGLADTLRPPFCSVLQRVRLLQKVKVYFAEIYLGEALEMLQALGIVQELHHIAHVCGVCKPINAQVVVC